MAHLKVYNVSGIRTFKGIPYAAPPVGNLRWREPQPAQNWTGVRKADHFGPRAMQLPLFGDMNFRSDGMSEDCLYLNVWTPSKTGNEHLPVLVYFYGGGFAAGDGSEPRYDGESIARRGVVTVTVNYRLTVFGFLHILNLLKNRHIMPPATRACSTKVQPCNGCSKTLLLLAEILRKLP